MIVILCKTMYLIVSIVLIMVKTIESYPIHDIDLGKKQSNILFKILSHIILFFSL